MELFKKQSLHKESIIVIIISFFLIVIGLIISSFLTFQSILKDEQLRNKQCSECINNVFNEEINHIKNYMLFLRDKILMDAPFSISRVEQVLKRHAIKHPLYTWHNFGWVDKGDKLLVNSAVGRLETPIDFSKIRGYLRYTNKNPGKFYFSDPAISIPADTDLVIPLGIGVIGYTGEFHGTLAAALNIEKLKKRVEYFLESCNGVNYLILNENGKPTIYSNNIKLEDDLSFPGISNKIKSFHLKNSFLEPKLDIASIKFDYYYKINDNPFYILTGTNQSRVYTQFASEIIPNILEFILLGLLFSMVLLYYRKRFITPISQLVEATENISRGIDTHLPKTDIYEIEALAHQVEKIKNFNKILQAEITNKTLELQSSLDTQKDIISKLVYYIKLPIQYINESCNELTNKWSEIKDNEKFARLMVIKRDNTKAHDLIHSISEFVGYTQDSSLEIQNHVDLKEVVTKVIKNITKEYKDSTKKLNIIFNTQTQVNTTINCDQHKIEQVFFRLLDNAVKYSNQLCNISITIDIYTVDTNYLIITISDQGIGVPAGEEKTIFNPFTKSTRTMLTTSKGIGLALCKKIIELHKGDIWVESSANINGTTVKFTLPLKLVKDKELNQNENIIIVTEQGIVYLSERESQCIRFLVEGKSMKETAKTLGISPRTVETHITHIKDKLKVKYKSELISIIKSNSNIYNKDQ